MHSLADAAELLGVLGDPSRVRLLALLEGEELSVAELVSITGLSQSRVSTHLGKLKDAGLLRTRRAGASALYGMDGSAPAAVSRLWQLLRSDLDDSVLLGDAKRREEVLAARRGTFPESVAGEMERHYSPGRTWESFAHGIAALLDLGDVLDVGAGDGAVARLLAPRARRLVCLDRSERMIQAARQRLKDASNVEFCVGDMHELPFDAQAFDRVALFNVLSYSQTPARVLSEAARVLRPAGAVVIQTLSQHEHMDIAARYGHVQAGFAAATLRRDLEAHGLEVDRCDVVAREHKAPHFEVLVALAYKPGRTSPVRSKRKKAAS